MLRKVIQLVINEKTAESLNSIAAMLEQKGDYVKALKLYEEIIEINNTIFRC